MYNMEWIILFLESSHFMFMLTLILLYNSLCLKDLEAAPLCYTCMYLKFLL